MRPVLLSPPEQRWSCPNCTQTAVTHLPPGTPASHFHTCRGLKGLTAPMVPAGADVKVAALEWGDYEHGELVQRDGEGRPVSAVITTRADGSNDTAVLAPSARFNWRED
jgi:hypothetical protein